MNGCLNILWHFPFFGFLFALFYALFGAILCCTVVLYPVGLGFFQIAQFLLSPFSSALVSRKELDLVRPQERSTAATAYSTIITVLYFPFGLIAAAGALFAMIGEFLSIIGIPCGIVWFKALPAIFMPVDKVCVPKAVADEIARIKAGDTVRRYKGETGEADSGPSERHFTEDPDDSLPPMPEVRQYDDEKLHEIVSNAAMYRASLVDDCRRELEIRSRSAEFTAQVRAMDNDKLHEVLSSPQLYAEELIYACTLEQTERRRVWREEEAKQEELRRLRREQEEKEAAERRAAAWKKWRPYVFATVAVLILSGAGIGYYSYHKEQVRLEQERIAWAKRMEEQRITEQKRVEAERLAAEAEARRIEAKKRAEEKRIADAKRAEIAHKAEIENRHRQGIYYIGEMHRTIQGVVFSINKTGKNGKIISTQEQIMSGNEASSLTRSGWRLPSSEELKVIFQNKNTINMTLKEYGYVPITNHSYWGSVIKAGYMWNISMSNGVVKESSVYGSKYSEKPKYYVRLIHDF